MRQKATPGTELRRAARCALVLASLLGAGALRPPAAVGQGPAATPEGIQRQREEIERRKLDYLDQKRRTDHINERVRQYKRLMAAIPFDPIPTTTNLVQVVVN